MDNNRRNHEEENKRPDRQNLEENQRIGRDIARQDNRNWNEQYRSGQNYHNQDEGYRREQTHYGSRPDSAYRQPNINFGNKQQSQNDRQPNNYRQQGQGQQHQRPYDQNRDEFEYGRGNSQQQHNQNQYRQPNQRNQSSHRERPDYESRNRDFDHPAQGDHAGTRFWGEREEYKADDYRYRSGNRGNWETPGLFTSEENDHDRNHSRNDSHHNEDRGFFGRMGDSISHAWDNMTNSGDDSSDDHYRRQQHPHDRHFNRGYESGPGWADEDDRYNNRNRRNRNNEY